MIDYTRLIVLTECSTSIIIPFYESSMMYAGNSKTGC